LAASRCSCREDAVGESTDRIADAGWEALNDMIDAERPPAVVLSSSPMCNATAKRNGNMVECIDMSYKNRTSLKPRS